MSENEFLRVPRIDRFSEVVQAYEAVFKDQMYKKPINDMNQKSLKCLNQKDVESILNTFLLKWGRMSRVLGFGGCVKIGEVLKEMNDELFDIRYYSLQNDFEKALNVAKFMIK